MLRDSQATSYIITLSVDKVKENREKVDFKIFKHRVRICDKCDTLNQTVW